MPVRQDLSARAPLRAFDVRLLGPVRVRSDDEDDVRLGGPKPTMVLVRLALRAGEVVSTDSLIDTLWGDDPPPTARRSLQAHVAKLRAKLGGDAGPVRSSGTGYVLDLPREQVDVLRVEDRLREARELLSTDPFRASEMVAACRGDWTDQPLADLDGYDTLTADRERLVRLGDELDDTEVELHVALGDPVSSILRLERAVADQPTHEPHWIRLITAYYASGRQQDALEAYRRACESLLDQLGVDPSPRLRQLEVQILRQEIDGSDPGAVCPYQGLVSYQIADGYRFYGRSDAIDEIVDSVKRAPVTVVVGASGAGKSSVLRAGVGHRVVTGQVPGIRSVAVITPGPNPMRSLFESPQVVDLLIVDQFEELFTLTDDTRRRTEFVDELLGLAAAGRTRVVIAVRADFYGACIGMPALVPVFGQHQVVVGAMSRLDIREAVSGPARQSQLDIEPALLDAVIDEVSEHPGALPMMSHALRETWRRRSGSTLTFAAYDDVGRIAGAIALTAERLYEGIGPEDRDEMQLLFQRLVEPRADGRHVRRSMTRDELADLGIDPNLVDRLVSARLLTVTTDRVELSHEALIDAWPRLTDWVDAEHDNIVVQQRLARAAAAWVEEGRDDADLYRGHKLDAAVVWRRDAGSALSGTEEEFLRASEAHAEAALVRQRRVNRRLRVFAGVSIAAMIGALGASIVAVESNRDAQRGRDEAEANRLAAVIGSDDSLSQRERLLGAAAIEARTPTPETGQLLFESMFGATESAMLDLDVSRVVSEPPSYSTGDALWVLDQHTRSAIVDAATLRLERLPIEIEPEYVVAAGDETFVVIANSYEVVALSVEAVLGPAPELEGHPASVALTVDGATLALGYDAADVGTAADHAVVDLIDVASGTSRVRVTVGSSTIRELEFSLDGARLMVETDAAAIELLDVDTGGTLLSVRPGGEPVFAMTSAAFDRRGGAVALGHRDGAVEIWREVDGEWRRVDSAVGHSNDVTWLEFDSSGSFLVSSDLDGLTMIRNVADGSLHVGPYWFGEAGPLTSYFGTTAEQIVAIDPAGRVRRWTTSPGGALAEISAVTSAAVPPSDSAAWIGVVDGVAVRMADASAATDAIDGMSAALDLEGRVLEVVNGWSGGYAVVFDDRAEWYRHPAQKVLTIPGEWNRVRPHIAIGGSSIAYTDPAAPRRIVVRDEDGSVVDEILVRRELWGRLARIDLDPSGTDLVYSTAEGELNWYSLDGFHADEILPSGQGYDAHFVGEDLAIAVGADGIQIIDVAGSTPTVEALGVGRGGVTAAYDQVHRVAATTDAAGELTVWDADRRRMIGSLPNVLGDELPEWSSFVNEDHLLVGGRTRTAVVSVGGRALLEVACAVLTADTADTTLRLDGTATDISVGEVCG